MQSHFLGIEIEINHNCNRTCAYCPNSQTKRKHQGDMSEELFVTLLGQLKDMGYRGRVSYHFYNEPLLSPNLERFVSLTREYLPECWIEIYTNGTLLDEARLMTLLTLGVDHFMVTKHHGSTSYPFDDLYKRLDPTIKAKIKYESYKDLTLTNRGGLVRAGSPKIKPPLDLPCYIPTSTVVITVNGNVLPCFEDYNEVNVMGNITENSLREIWESDRYQKFRTDLKQRKRSEYSVCKDCNSAQILA